MVAALNLEDKLRGAMWGLLIGDAYGVPYEFHSAAEIPKKLSMTPPKDFRRAHPGVPPGTWSDDGAQALCLLESLLQCDCMNPIDFVETIIEWWQNGHLAVDGKVFDIGNTTQAALDATMNDNWKNINREEDSNGNGSLMRTLPLGLWHQGANLELVRDAHLQSAITHPHIRSQICCAILCMWTRFILAGDNAAWEKTITGIKKIYEEEFDEIYTIELNEKILPNLEGQGKGSGYVVDSLCSAKWAFGHKTYREVVEAAIRLGDDTDTTACIAGGLAGLRDGFTAIPQELFEAMREKETADKLIEQLIKYRRSS